MVSIGRPTRSKASQRVNKDDEPSVCLPRDKIVEEQQSMEHIPAQSSGTRDDPEAKCWEPSSSSSNGYSVAGMDSNILTATNQLHEPCSTGKSVISSNASSRVKNFLTENELITYQRREPLKEQRRSVLLAPLKMYSRRKKGHLLSSKPLKTYSRRTNGSALSAMNSLLIQNSERNRGEDTILGYPVEAPSLMASNNTCQKEFTAADGASLNAGNLVLDKDTKVFSHVKLAAAESENNIILVLPGSELLASDERVSAVNAQDESMVLDHSNELDANGGKMCNLLVVGESLSKSIQSQHSKPPYDASSWSTSDTNLVERIQDSMEEPSQPTMLSLEADALTDLISRPGNRDTKILPDISSSGRYKRKLLVLDINGLLADIVPIAYISDRYRPEPDAIISGKSVFKRPFCDEFLEFCFGRFSVDVWSSRTKRNVASVLDFLFGEVRHNLLFCWDQSHCTHTSYNTLGNTSKPLVFKKLNKLWENSENDLPWKRGDYDESNTLLLDDSPYKALLNPPNTAIFPHTYQYRDEADNSLGPGGDLRIYLEGLTMAANVQDYVEKNPFGQQPITEEDASWSFYDEVIKSTMVSPPIIPSQSLESSVNLQKDVSKADVQGDPTSGTSQQDLKTMSGLLKVDEIDRQATDVSLVGGKSSDSPRGIQRHHKRGRGGSTSSLIHNRSSCRSRSQSLSPKRCRRSRSPSRWQGNGFGVVKAGRDQILSPKCRNFLRGRCLKGVSCCFVHHQPGESGGLRYNLMNQQHPHVLLSSRSSDVYRESKNTFSDRPSYELNEGKVQSFKQDTPISDLGEAVHGKDVNICDRMRRDKAMPRGCYDFIRGKCNWGEACRFLHSKPDKTDRSRSCERKTDVGQAMEGHGENANLCDRMRRDKAVPRECCDYIRGKCNWGEACRFLHSKPDQTYRSRSCERKTDVGQAMEGHGENANLCDRIRRDNAVPRECYDFIRGKCKWGAACRFLHSEPCKTDRSRSYESKQDTPMTDAGEGIEGHRKYVNLSDRMRREKAEPRDCYDFIQGKCSWGATCRFLHSEPGKTDRPRSYESKPDTPILDVGEAMEGHDKNANLCDRMRRDKAVRRECHDFIRGKCNWGAACRFFHSEPDKTDRSRSYESKQDTPMTDAGEGIGHRKYVNLSDRMRRDKAEPRDCYDFIHGKCSWGATCRFLHSEPGKTDRPRSYESKPNTPVLDVGEAMEEHGKNANLCDRMRRDKAVPRECHDFIRGKCNWGAACRFFHSEPDKTDRSRSYESKKQYQATQFNLKTSNICEEAESISFHELGLPRSQDSGKDTVITDEIKNLRHEHGQSFSQIHDTVRGNKALRPGCRNYVRGICRKGSFCRYLHQGPDPADRPGSYRSHWQHQKLPIRSGSSNTCWNTESNDPRKLDYEHKDHDNTSRGGWQPHDNKRRKKEPPQQCFDFTGGKCRRGVHCRYLHHEPNQWGGSQYSWSKQQHEDIPWCSKSSDTYGKTESIPLKGPGDEHIEPMTQGVEQEFPGVEERRDMAEELPKSTNHVTDHENFPEGSVLTDPDANDEKAIDIVVCCPPAVIENPVKPSQVYCSDQMITDTACQPELMNAS